MFEMYIALLEKQEIAINKPLNIYFNFYFLKKNRYIHLTNFGCILIQLTNFRCILYHRKKQ